MSRHRSLAKAAVAWSGMNEEGRVKEDLPGQTELEMPHIPLEELKRLLAHAKQWQGDATDFRLGGGPFNTEGLRMLLTAHVQLLEVLIAGKASTPLPLKHHA